MTPHLIICRISKTPDIDKRAFLALHSSTFLRSDRMVKPNMAVPRNVPKCSRGERSNVPPPIYIGRNVERTPKDTSRSHDQEVRLPTPDHRLDGHQFVAGHTCAAPGCGARLYNALTLCHVHAPHAANIARQPTSRLHERLAIKPEGSTPLPRGRTLEAVRPRSAGVPSFSSVRIGAFAQEGFRRGEF